MRGVSYPAYVRVLVCVCVSCHMRENCDVPEGKSIHHKTAYSEVYWCKVVIICRHVLGGGKGDGNGQGWKLSVARCLCVKYEEQINIVVFCFTAISPPLCRGKRGYADVDESMQTRLLSFCPVGPQFDKPSPKQVRNVRVVLRTKRT